MLVLLRLDGFVSGYWLSLIVVLSEVVMVVSGGVRALGGVSGGDQYGGSIGFGGPGEDGKYWEWV